jgi:hypothetical protein
VKTAPTPAIDPGTTRNGSLATTDGVDSYYAPDFGYFIDDYILTGASAGTPVIISVGSNAFDTTLELVDAFTGASIAVNDDASEDTSDSALGLTPQSGRSYVIRVSSYDEEDTGSYSLRVQ